MKLPQTGGCQCGAIRYEITQGPQMVYTCHCTDCQAMTSSAFSMALVLPAESFRLVTGEPKAVQHTADSGRVSIWWVCPGMRLVDLRRPEACLDSPQRASRHTGRYLLAAPDCTLLDPQQTTLDSVTVRRPELRYAA